MQSRNDTKYYSLKKALAKELKKPNPDKESLLMLHAEIEKVKPQINIVTK